MIYCGILSHKSYLRGIVASPSKIHHHAQKKSWSNNQVIWNAKQVPLETSKLPLNVPNLKEASDFTDKNENGNLWGHTKYVDNMHEAVYGKKSWIIWRF